MRDAGAEPFVNKQKADNERVGNTSGNGTVLRYGRVVSCIVDVGSDNGDIGGVLSERPNVVSVAVVPQE